MSETKVEAYVEHAIRIAPDGPMVAYRGVGHGGAVWIVAESHRSAVSEAVAVAVSAEIAGTYTSCETGDAIVSREELIDRINRRLAPLVRAAGSDRIVGPDGATVAYIKMHSGFDGWIWFSSTGIGDSRDPLYRATSEAILGAGCVPTADELALEINRRLLAVET